MAQSSSLLTPDFLLRLDRMELQTRRVLGGQVKGERRSRHKGVGLDFADYRHYTRGDDLRHIDWNLYGRLDRLFIKIFHEEQDLQCHLLLDTSRSMHFGSPQKLLFGKQLAAAIAYTGLKGNDKISLTAFDAHPGRSFGPFRGRHQVRRMLAMLDALESAGETSLEAMCRDLAVRVRGRSVVVLISDLLDPAGYETALRYLTRESLDVFVVHLLSPEEIQPPANGHVELLDAETGHKVEITVNPRLLKVYQTNLAAFTGAAKDFCLKRGMFYSLVRSDARLEDLVLRDLRRAGLLQQ